MRHKYLIRTLSFLLLVGFISSAILVNTQSVFSCTNDACAENECCDIVIIDLMSETSSVKSDGCCEYNEMVKNVSATKAVTFTHHIKIQNIFPQKVQLPICKSIQNQTSKLIKPISSSAGSQSTILRI